MKLGSRVFFILYFRVTFACAFSKLQNFDQTAWRINSFLYKVQVVRVRCNVQLQGHLFFAAVLAARSDTAVLKAPQRELIPT